MKAYPSIPTPIFFLGNSFLDFVSIAVFVVLFLGKGPSLAGSHGAFELWPAEKFGRFLS